jgi:ubiquinone/menaquinone biosynthesis C-methylase UbiE
MTREQSYIPAMGQHWLLFLYDPLNRLWGVPQTHRALLDQAAVRPGQDVLEIGTGTGNLLLAQARRTPGARLRGIDPDEAGLRRARRKARRARSEIVFERAYAGRLPFAPDSFDRVLSSFMLHHLDAAESQRAFREIHRVLRPGGEAHVVDIAGLAPGHRAGKRHPHLVGDLPARVLDGLRAAGLTAEQTGRTAKHVFYRATRTVGAAWADHPLAP